MLPSRRATLAVLAALTLGPLARPQEAGPAARILKLFADEFVPIAPGQAGKPATVTLGAKDAKAATERPAALVKLAAPFHIAKYEVTQELYELVMGRNPSRWKGPRNSVEMTSWDDAVSFCRKVTEKLREAKLLGADEEIRLPSEAEWEYCCRAGTTTAYSFGDDPADLGEYGWYSGNAKGNDPPVGKKKPNPWGLYDFHGYVWEWCADDWSATHAGLPADGTPRRVDGAKERVVKGGSWADPAERARSAARAGRPVGFTSEAVGFRCVKAKVAGGKK